MLGIAVHVCSLRLGQLGCLCGVLQLTLMQSGSADTPRADICSLSTCLRHWSAALQAQNRLTMMCAWPSFAKAACCTVISCNVWPA